MARYSYGTLRSHLSSLANYLEAIAELRAQLLHSSPSLLITNPTELISLVEVAKSTLQNNGVSLHTFSSCPGYLSAYKVAYFGLLLRIQAHTHNALLESKDLKARLNRLLFPLSTKLSVGAKSAGKAVAGGYADQLCGVQQAETNDSSDEMRPALLGPGAEANSPPISNCSVFLSGPPDPPPNIMLPPPSPLRPTDSVTTSRSIDGQSKAFYNHRREPSWQLSTRREISQNTLHFKRRRSEDSADEHTDPALHFKRRRSEDSADEHIDPASWRERYRNPKEQKPHPGSNLHKDDLTDVRIDEADISGSSSDDSEDSDSDSGHVIVPANSPLRFSLGIFCTGKGHGTFNPPGSIPRQSPRPLGRTSQSSLRRELTEDFTDTGRGCT